MVNEKILDIAEQLQDVVKDQMIIAKNSLSDLPDGGTKEKLGELLSKASSGKLSHIDAKRELEKITKGCL